jgi:hypothetical protein
MWLLWAFSSALQSAATPLIFFSHPKKDTQRPLLALTYLL